MDYKQLIVEMILKMENENFLNIIYSFVKVIYEKEKITKR